MARAAEMLTGRCADLPRFAAIGFPGYTLKGAELTDLVDLATGAKAKRGGMPWPILRLMGLFSPLMREAAEMRYLWRRPHAIEGADFAAILPDFHPTEPAQAIRASLAACGRLDTTPLAPAKGSVITA